MRYRVMVECEDGTHTLRDNPLRWERNLHVITWCVEDTREAADRARAGLHVELNPTARRAWVEEVT